MGDSALRAGIGVGLALEETARVADGSLRKREAVQHRQSVEPVPKLLRADLEERGSGSDEDALKPLGKASGQRETCVADLAGQRREAKAVPHGSASAQP